MTLSKTSYYTDDIHSYNLATIYTVAVCSDVGNNENVSFIMLGKQIIMAESVTSVRKVSNSISTASPIILTEVFCGFTEPAEKYRVITSVRLRPLYHVVRNLSVILPFNFTYCQVLTES